MQGGIRKTLTEQQLKTHMDIMCIYICINFMDMQSSVTSSVYTWQCKLIHIVAQAYTHTYVCMDIQSSKQEKKSQETLILKSI